MRATLSLVLLLSFPPLFAKTRAVHVPSLPPRYVVHAIPLSYVTSIAAARDGAIWFAGADVGVLHSDGSAEIVARGQCGPIAVGADDTVWCAHRKPGDAMELIRRIDANRTVTDIPVRAGAGIRALLPRDDGSLLFSEAGKDRLGRIDANGNVEESALAPSLDGPGPMTVANDGTVWLATRRAVARVNASQVEHEHRADSLFARRSASSGFSSITPSLWLAIPTEPRVSQFATGGAIVRFTMDGAFTEVLKLPLLHSPSFLAEAPDGSLWFVDRDDFFLPSDTVVRLRPDGTMDRRAMPQLDPFTRSTAADLIVTGSGAVFVAVNYVSGGAAIAHVLE